MSKARRDYAGGWRSGGWAEQGITLDRAGITAFRDITFLAVGPASERNSSAAALNASVSSDRRAKKTPRFEVNGAGTVAL